MDFVAKLSMNSIHGRLCSVDLKQHSGNISVLRYWYMHEQIHQHSLIIFYDYHILGTDVLHLIDY